METVMPQVKDVSVLFERLKKNSHVFAGSHSVHTPQELTEEILMNIPHLDDGKTFLVLFNVEFVFTLVYTYGVNTSNITFYSDHPKKTASVKYVGCKVITSLDDIDMKFDVVVGNPPYQNSHNAKRWPLWHQFVIKSKEISDIVALIVPASLIGPGKAFKDIKNNTKLISLDVEKHFNVGSTFCYFILDKVHKGQTTLVTKDKSYSVSLPDKDFLPLKINEHTLNLLNKLKGNRVWERGEFHTSNKEWQSKMGVPVHHTNAQTLFTNTQHKNLSKIRVCVTLSGYPRFKAIQNEGCSQANFWTEFSSLEEAKIFADKCNDSEVQEILNTFKWSGWNSKEVIKKL
jgi:hypothetical protein